MNRSARRVLAFFLLIGIFSYAVFFAPVTYAVYTSCSSVSDASGDSGSSFPFTDIVSTELTNQGDRIGITITTAGTIPNDLGSTGEIGFGIWFPAILLSEEYGDGLNSFLVHYLADGSGWGASQIIYAQNTEVKRESFSANFTRSGNTLSFSVPKDRIGKGILAYQTSIDFVSFAGESETGSTDTAPDQTFVDCYVTSPQPTSVAATGGDQIVSSPSQSISEGPKREENTIVEQSGVVRTTNADVGQSLAVKTTPTSPPTAQPQKITDKTAVETSNILIATKPSRFAVGLLLIILGGIAAVGIGSFITNPKLRKPMLVPISLAPPSLGKQHPKRIPWPFDWLDLWNRFISLFPWFLLVGKPPPPPPPPPDPCNDGDRVFIGWYVCQFLLLDPNGEVHFETKEEFTGTNRDAQKLADWLGVTEHKRKWFRGQPWWFDTKNTHEVLEYTKPTAKKPQKEARNFHIVYVEIPVQWRINVCEEFWLCVKKKWELKTKLIDSLIIPHKLRIDAKQHTQYNLNGVTLEDFPDWLKKVLEENFADPKYITDHPCDC